MIRLRFAAPLAYLAALVLALVDGGGRAGGHAGARPPALIICEVWGDRLCGPALRVAWCESRLRPAARNGQYLGLFQMGAYARRRFGHGPDAYTQARAAYRYFRVAGWRPWTCRP